MTATAARFTDIEFKHDYRRANSLRSPRIDDRFIELADDTTKPFKKQLALLNSFASFPPGWNNGEGHAISSTAVNEAAKFMQLFNQELNILVEVYPLNSGGILIEGLFESLEFHIDFTIGGSAEISISRGDVVLVEGPIGSASSAGQRLIELLFFAVR